MCYALSPYVIVAAPAFTRDCMARNSANESANASMTDSSTKLAAMETHTSFDASHLSGFAVCHQLLGTKRISHASTSTVSRLARVKFGYFSNTSGASTSSMVDRFPVSDAYTCAPSVGGNRVNLFRP